MFRYVFYSSKLISATPETFFVCPLIILNLLNLKSDPVRFISPFPFSLVAGYKWRGMGSYPLARWFVRSFVRSLGGSYIQPVESLVDGKGVHNSIYHTIQSATYVCSGVPYTVLNVRSIPLFASNVDAPASNEWRAHGVSTCDSQRPASVSCEHALVRWMCELLPVILVSHSASLVYICVYFYVTIYDYTRIHRVDFFLHC